MPSSWLSPIRSSSLWKKSSASAKSWSFWGSPPCSPSASSRMAMAMSAADGSVFGCVMGLPIGGGGGSLWFWLSMLLFLWKKKMAGRLLFGPLLCCTGRADVRGLTLGPSRACPFLLPYVGVVESTADRRPLSRAYVACRDGVVRT
eukprot:scaffold65860_cov54-Attheya_sp.AAC.1